RPAPATFVWKAGRSSPSPSPRHLLSPRCQRSKRSTRSMRRPTRLRRRPGRCMAHTRSPPVLRHALRRWST
ncbi:hypothetical protein MNEG_2764, partial [Monoraphidium neglectum]